MTNKIEENNQKIESLLVEFDDHRVAIKAMIEDLESIRTKIDNLIPTSLDARYMRFFEEKVKSITALFNALLEMRKEIVKSVKDEVDIRRRITDPNELINIEDMVDVRDVVSKIEEFKLTNQKMKDERIRKNKEQTIDETIDIPGVTSRVEGVH